MLMTQGRKSRLPNVLAQAVQTSILTTYWPCRRGMVWIFMHQLKFCVIDKRFYQELEGERNRPAHTVDLYQGERS
jgi:hypothetical protein